MVSMPSSKCKLVRIARYCHINVQQRTRRVSFYSEEQRVQSPIPIAENRGSNLKYQRKGGPSIHIGEQGVQASIAKNRGFKLR